MKLNKAQSIGVMIALLAVVAGIMVAGFLWRPTWSSEAAALKAKDLTRSKLLEQISRLSPEEKQAMLTCQGNRALILSAATSYFAVEGMYPPGGVINKDHPLVKKGFLKEVPVCPSTGKEYVLTVHPKGTPPSTKCPSGIPYHDL